MHRMQAERALPTFDPEQDRYLAEIIAILRAALRGVPCSAWLFGSRAAGRSVPTSDVDIAIGSPHDIAHQLSLAREMLENSNVPLVVDVVDLKDASEELLGALREEGIALSSEQ